jgi:hypothetical protein
MLEPTEKNAAIAVYDSHSEAEEVIKELERGGFAVPERQECPTPYDVRIELRVH